MNYSYIDAKRHKDTVTVWCRDDKGKLIVEEFPLSDYLYCYILDNSGDPDATDIYGRPLKKLTFSDRYAMQKFVDSRDELFESDVQPEYKVIRDSYSNALMTAPYNVLFYDIEVFVDLSTGDGYPTPKNPYGYVNLFQGFDYTRKEYVIIKLDECDVPNIRDEYKEFPVVTISCRSEAELLRAVADELEYRDVDVMTAWFGNGFDLPYLMVRAEMNFGVDTAARMFCRDGFKARSREYIDSVYGEERIEWTLVGRQHLDMMEVYKKFIPGEKTSFSLSAVATEDLGVDKVDYEGDLGELYRENPEEFVRYGVHDVRLLKKLNDKHQIIELAMTMARMNGVFARDVTGSVRPIEHGIMKMCHEMGIVLPDKKYSEKVKFPGAIVYDAIAGRHGWVFSVDLSGLYPSVMKMLGLSPDTLIMQLHGEYEDYVRVMTKSDEEVLVDIIEYGDVSRVEVTTGRELEELIRENGWTIAGSGAIFAGHLGLLAQYVDRGIKLRKEYQTKMKEAAAAGDDAASEMYDLYQKVVKIMNNSTYGVTGETSFRLFDLRLSKAITLTARVISKFQAFKANDLLEQMKG